MHSAKIFSAIVAVGAAVAAAADTTCTKNIEISEPSQVIDCDVVDADVTVAESLAGDVVINGPKQIKGDLIVNNATKLISLSSTTINAIGGKFQLQNLELLSSLKMDSLKSLNEAEFIKLPQLSALSFGTTGVTKINSIRVTDTFISDLSGLSVATVDTLQIDNNKKMTKFDSDLVNITGKLIINNNGNNMEIKMADLEMIAEMQISNVKSFEVPALETVTESIKFDKNPELKSFATPNLTKITDDVSFINNKKLTNITMPLLKKISGGLIIQNNTALETIDGFPLLETVSGGVTLAGSFEKVELPKLKDVQGSVTVTSTTDISDFCKFFDDAKKDGSIRGKEKCTSDNAKANEGGDDGKTNSGSSKSGSDDDEEDAAGIVSVNMAILALVGVAGIAQLF